MPIRNRVTALGRGFALLLLAQMVIVAATVSADAPSAGQTFAGPLDGKVFVGKLEAVDGAVSLDDTLHFRGGHFWSSGCTRCSFMPGGYWTRQVDGAIEFRGVLESPERGRFTYLGRVENGEVRATINWRRDRWYWSVDRDYRFVGRLKPPDLSDTSLDQARLRAAGEAAPTCPI